jgi:peptide/nickel transport system permease protein
LTHYLIRRLLWAALVVFVVTLVTFGVFFLLPTGDPASRFAGRQPDPQVIAQIRHEFGLDHRWYVQYGLYVKHLFLGDRYGWPGLGFSYDTRVPIREELLTRAPRTLSLAIGAAIVWLVGGIAIGVVSAIKPRSIFDRVGMGFALVGISAPVFWLGLISLYVFWQKLHILPGTGYVAFGHDPGQWFMHLVQPWVVLALLYAAFYARMTRGIMLETMAQDYIRTARAKGLSRSRVVLRHGLRNGILPIVTMVGIDLGLLLGGAIVTESVFNIQGLGYWVVQAVYTQDFPVVVAVVFVGACSIVLLNLLVDVAYVLLDPRVRY